MREALDLEIGHGDGIGGGGGTSSAAVAFENGLQSWIVPGYNNADAQGAKDEEQHESPVDCFIGIFDDMSRSASFCRTHGDVLGANNAKGCGPKSGTEPFEATEITGAPVFGKRPRGLLIAKSIWVVLRIAADHGDKGEKE
jgi:hypothetical protein